MAHPPRVNRLTNRDGGTKLAAIGSQEVRRQA